MIFRHDIFVSLLSLAAVGLSFVLPGPVPVTSPSSAAPAEAAAPTETVERVALTSASPVDPDLKTRFEETTDEVPDFQKHVVPMLTRLGCNGRSCHGSFQGQGGFQLSLFGYDFKEDLKEMMEEGEGRIDLDDPEESLVLAKPSNEDNHEGGELFTESSWQYQVIKNWIKNGAVVKESLHRLERLEIQPAEILATSTTKVQLKAIAHWADGTHEDVTPLTRFQTNNEQVATITENGVVRSPEKGDTHVVAFYDKAVVPIPVIHRVASVDTNSEMANRGSQIDRLVVQKLSKLGIKQSPLADDVTFLRRVYLDVAGTLPSPDQIRSFLADKSPDKRTQVIEKLLETPAHAALWTTFFCDLTGNNSQDLRDFAYGKNFGAQFWYDWIYDKIENNVPYDDMVEGILLGNSRIEGESYTDYCQRMSAQSNGDGDMSDMEEMPVFWMRREFQKSEERAIGVAHAFLGIRIQCAQCHKHPFDQWSKADFEQFSRFFTGIKLEPVGRVAKEDRAELRKLIEDIGATDKKGGELRKRVANAAKQGKVVPFPQLVLTEPFRPDANKLNKQRKKDKLSPLPKHFETAELLGGTVVKLDEYDDVREPIMDWLRSPDNPYFAKAIANRIWAHYFGVGIVAPADDLNLANPPSNAPLLDYLAKGFIESGYDLRWIHREITNSKTYQLSWETNETNQGDRRNFSRALPRRLQAEVLYDALIQSTSPGPRNARALNQIEPRAIAIPGTVNGRGKAGAGFALNLFGRSTRSTNCDCDQSTETSLTQTVFLQNDSSVHALIGAPRGWIGQLEESEGSTKNLESKMKKRGNLILRGEKATERLRTKQKTNRPDQVARIQRELNKLRLQITAIEREIAELKEGQRLAVGAPQELIIEAYLRTLSRYPAPNEMNRCLQFLEDAESTTEGLKGVVWALLNTKEFIVNH